MNGNLKKLTGARDCRDQVGSGSVWFGSVAVWA